jgi:hypothetical protein
MGLFRRDKVVDLTEEYKQQRKVRAKENSEAVSSDNAPVQTQETSSGGFFNFFGNSNSNSSSSSSEVSSPGTPNVNEPLDAEEKRRRLAKRLKTMTDRIEDMSNQIYLLQQRIEVLEKKNNVGKYE